MRRVACFLAVGLAVGCGGETEAKKKPMQMSEVPPVVVKAAQDALPGVTLDQAFREPNGNIELRGKDKNGKIREADVTPEGKIADIE